MTLNLFLAVTPRAAARTRCVCRGRFPNVYNEPAYRDWLKEATEQVRQQTAHLTAREGDAIVILTAVVAKPKSTKKVRPKGDVDNFQKGVLDAITQAKTVWVDDDQVVTIGFTKRWAEDGLPEGYHVSIQFLENPNEA